jgi:hypothetical protein
LIITLVLKKNAEYWRNRQKYVVIIPSIAMAGHKNDPKKKKFLILNENVAKTTSLLYSTGSWTDGASAFARQSLPQDDRAVAAALGGLHLGHAGSGVLQQLHAAQVYIFDRCDFIFL